MMKTKILLFLMMVVLYLPLFGQLKVTQKITYYNDATFDKSPIIPRGTAINRAVNVQQMNDSITHAINGIQMVYPTAGLVKSNGNAWNTSITDNSTLWNTVTNKIDKADSVSFSDYVSGTSGQLATFIGPNTVTGMATGNVGEVLKVVSEGVVGFGPGEYIPELSSAPETGNIYINSSDNYSLWVKGGGTWLKVGTTGTGGTSSVIDSYSDSNQNAVHYLSSISDLEVGQAFTASASCVLSSAKFYLGKEGSPTGYAVAKLYAITGTYGVDATPTGSALATSDNLDVSTVGVEGTLVTFTFSGANNISLTSNGQYAIMCSYSGGDVNNRLTIGVDTTAPTHNGNDIEYAGGTYYPTTYDCIFYVYGTN